MITSDAHESIQDAISKVFPDVPWQRCQFHFSKNISEKAPKKYQAGIRADLQEMWNCKDLSSARKKRDSIIADYKDVAESAMKCLNEGFESSMTVMVLPKGMRRFFRTSNHIERLNKELKRRSTVIGVFPKRRLSAAAYGIRPSGTERSRLYTEGGFQSRDLSGPDDFGCCFKAAQARKGTQIQLWAA